MKRKIPIYIIYAILIFLFFSPTCLGLLSGNNPFIMNVVGGMIFAGLTGGMLGLTTTSKNNQLQLEKTNLAALPEKTQLELLKMTMSSPEFKKLKTNKNSFKPFDEIITEINTDASRMVNKMHQIQYLLSESFSPDDLTYITYKDSIEEVLKIYNSNLTGTIKRFLIFDYIEYRNNPNNDLAKVYISEVTELKNNNRNIVEKIDKLLLELVRLDDITNVSFDEINELIEQTKNYKNK